MSCSDKIALWALIGLEGSLLSHFVEPVPLTSVTIALENGAATPAAVGASKRALSDRFAALRESCTLNSPYPLPPLQVWFSSGRLGVFPRCRAVVEERTRRELVAAASLALEVVQLTLALSKKELFFWCDPSVHPVAIIFWSFRTSIRWSLFQ